MVRPERLFVVPRHHNNLFGFSEDWFTLGIVNPALLERMRVEWDRGEDQHTKHYRWRAFCEFLSSQRPLNQSLAESLFKIGAVDPDPSMGGAIMAEILRLPECPESVMRQALTSGRLFLIRIAQKRLKVSAGG